MAVNWLTQILSAIGKPLQWWVVVAPWERGLRIRRGKTATVLLPGIRLRIPFLDRIYVQSVRLRTLWDTGLTVTTKDGYVLTIAVAIHFAVGDMLKLYDALANPETTLRTRAAAAAAREVSRRRKDKISTEGIERAIRDELGSYRERFGLGEVSADVTGFAFARTLRLLVNDYSHSSGLYDFEKDASGLK